MKNPTTLLFALSTASLCALIATPTSAQGLTGIYYDGQAFETEHASRVDGPIEFDWNSDNPIEGLERTTFSVRWTGQVTPLYSETYTFHTISDDGVRLWVNGKLLIEKWQGQGATEHTGTVQLTAGQPVDIVLDYYQGSGGASMELLWSSSTQVREHIPPTALSPNSNILQATPRVGLFIVDPTLTEGSADTATITVYRYGRLDRAEVVNLSYAGDATPDDDIQTLPATIELPIGRTSRRVEIATNEDDEVEGNETLEISVATGFGYDIDPNAGTVAITITDNDTPSGPLTYSITGNIDVEGPLTSQIVVAAFTDTSFSNEVARRILVQDGQYAITGLAPGSYSVRAFVDLNENGNLDDDEPTFAPSENTFTLPPDAFGVDVSFSLPDPNAPDDEDDEGCSCTTLPTKSPIPLGAFLILLGAVVMLNTQKSPKKPS